MIINMLTTIHSNVNAKTGPLIKQLALLILIGLIWSSGVQIQYLQDPHSPSGGMLVFLRLSRSSVVSLATAVPLLVLLRTLKARFRRRNERLRTDVLSKLRSVNEC